MKLSREHHRAGEAEFDSECLLVQAKAGDGAATGRLLEHYRNYVGLLIRLRGGRRLRKRADAEDLFQEIGLEIHRRIATFRGNSVREVLDVDTADDRIDPDESGSARRPGDRVPGPAAGAGSPGIDETGDPSRHLEPKPAAPRAPPAASPARLEQTVLLADALDKLPEAYREVIILRNLEGIGFPEVARRLGRTEDSVKNVWLRALARLRRILEEPG